MNRSLRESSPCPARRGKPARKTSRRIPREHGDGFLRVHSARISPDDFARSMMSRHSFRSFSNRAANFVLASGVILAYLHQQVEVVEVVAASMRVVSVIEQSHDAAHGLFYAFQLVVIDSSSVHFES